MTTVELHDTREEAQAECDRANASPIRGMPGARCVTCDADISTLPSVGMWLGAPHVWPPWRCDRCATSGR